MAYSVVQKAAKSVSPQSATDVRESIASVDVQDAIHNMNGPSKPSISAPCEFLSLL
jgi:hypothetical protein